MLKKILYIIGSFLLGFLLIITVMNTTLINVLQTRVKDAVAEKNYPEAKRYFSGIYDKTTNFVLSGENGEHIEIYYGMANANHTFKKDNGEDASYETIEAGIHLAIFNLTDDFKLADEEGKQGGVKLYFDNWNPYDELKIRREESQNKLLESLSKYNLKPVPIKK